MSTLAQLLGMSPKSIQFVQGLNAGSGFTTISEVDLSKSVILSNPTPTLSGNAYAPGVRFQSSTQVAPTLNVVIGNASAWIIDFGDLVKNVQRGSRSPALTSNITVAPYNTSKAILLTDAGYYSASGTSRTYTNLVSSTSINVYNSSGTGVIYWQLVEFH